MLVDESGIPERATLSELQASFAEKIVSVQERSSRSSGANIAKQNSGYSDLPLTASPVQHFNTLYQRGSRFSFEWQANGFKAVLETCETLQHSGAGIQFETFTHWNSKLSPMRIKWHYLSFSIDSDDSSCRFVGRGDKNGLSTDSVHVDTGACFKVIQMDVTVFCDQEDHIVLFADLPNNGNKPWGCP